MNFEKSRQELLKRIKAMKEQDGDGGLAAPSASLAPKIVLFGASTPFLNSILEILNSKAATSLFSDAEGAIGCCLDHGVKRVVLDMDEPTDWKLSTDVFSSVKMLARDTGFVLLTRTPKSVAVETLVAQGAVALRKPFDREHLLALVDGLPQ